MRRELVCVETATPPRLAARSVELPQPRAGEVLVRVQATTVNPIDVKRATGYGRRLLGLKGAARFPLVLGNDVAGIVEALGAGVTRFARGQPVFGLLGTGRAGGAHASHVVVPQDLLLPAPKDADPAALAVLPYSFTTMWLALRSTGINPTSAQWARVLIHGANGGLGRLAMQVLRPWGCAITAICAKGQRQTALELGAQVAVEHSPACIESLSSDFDVVLNFANWDEDALLASRLSPRALGHATTVHPLLANFDRFGWLGGAWTSRRDRRQVGAIVASRAPKASYSWTIFKPDRDALEALAAGVRARAFALPIGIAAPFGNAIAAFDHVSSGQPGRAVLLP
ncbi:alcohol dehydrogenase catalytic domain-containing protein [Variovorax ginsengisoli]|uniref:Alcohol dehydrogenase catalytic domain-containing protein n=1 Tax=Variovorax ginsengisoli TaxID=363844 RepID=A0ABT8S1M0_9BURK|nr:alcohol dehydrogenase catalytic domain-containing protein [Variovorax ginsengisoli]MDN8613659.1 alcohol dehydrogenase catalytic domain-containing protein [Variovorax ginsengisoli]MDO1532829.1 alcohol dehydrogenase catalytic domain-containing protein [Variovorax ginsengisoli]